MSCKFYAIFHISNAALSSSMLEYLGIVGSDIILLRFLMASIVALLGISNFNSKGIPCSLIVVLKNILTAVVMLIPSSLKISSA